MLNTFIAFIFKKLIFKVFSTCTSNIFISILYFIAIENTIILK